MISKLSQRERITLLIGGGVLLAILLFLGVVEPYRDGMDRLDSQIAARSRQVEQVRSLRRDYLRLKGNLQKAEKRFDTAKAFSLFSTVESITSRVADKENLVYMRPQPTTTQEGILEESVEIKVEKVSLNQMVRFLYEIEATSAYLQIKNLRMKTRFDDRTLLDTVLTISHYGKTP